ncbi:hypothetical protein [Streptomyces alanosinicus]|uniref:Uncharacterized protein n=1 Tax=Streptomyces alanosinicus TaxID=68171 RepID=A0A919D176_9ACTN|nr:hypothetical protein [Streptomyces alanosinicus]GHE00213.1 hypothetical protein GCM10010339_14400 [Streptomyces alanosinicus]
MTYNLLTVEPLNLDTITAVLAQCLHVREQEVDVADEDTDQELRNWDALVLCGKKSVLGDVSTSLDIYVQESVQPQPDESELASAFARAAGAVVLFPAEDVPVSAYWLATEDGRVTRARLYDSDDEEPVFTIDTVEAPVARLPHVAVALIPEVVRELKIATPVSDAFDVHLEHMRPDQAGTLGTPLRLASDRLGAWEKLIRHMEASWASSGWCPPDLYRERLEARDDLEQVRGQLPHDAATLLQKALEPLDALFAELTVDDTGGLLRKELPLAQDAASEHGWWWNRRPDPLPW